MKVRELTALLAVLVVSVTVSAQAINWDGLTALSKTTGELLNAEVPLESASPVRAEAAYTVQMEDTLNKFTAQLGVSLKPGSGETVYTVANKQSPDSDENSEKIIVRGGDEAIETEAGVPKLTPNEILARYSADVEKLLADGTLTIGQNIWTLKAGKTNNKLELALMMFLVNEWFYYG